jgi:hypothetical protein
MLPYQHLLPNNFSMQSKVWVYQASRPLLMSEALDLEEEILSFVANWQSHGAKVEGYANLLFGRFLVFISNEANTQVSGCSTDAMVRTVQKLEQQLNIKFTDRTQLAFLRNNKIEAIPISQLEYALEHKHINNDTIYFNNMVANLYDFLHNWQIATSTSWISKRYQKYFEEAV